MRTHLLSASIACSALLAVATPVGAQEPPTPGELLAEFAQGRPGRLIEVLVNPVRFPSGLPEQLMDGLEAFATGDGGSEAERSAAVSVIGSAGSAILDVPMEGVASRLERIYASSDSELVRMQALYSALQLADQEGGARFLSGVAATPEPEAHTAVLLLNAVGPPGLAALRVLHAGPAPPNPAVRQHLEQRAAEGFGPTKVDDSKRKAGRS